MLGTGATATSPVVGPSHFRNLELAQGVGVGKLLPLGPKGSPVRKVPHSQGPQGGHQESRAYPQGEEQGCTSD